MVRKIITETGDKNSKKYQILSFEALFIALQLHLVTQ